ncbi:MAG: hypothetical protein ACKV19_11810 [Verrucomicrobiales bacterium]
MPVAFTRSMRRRLPLLAAGSLIAGFCIVWAVKNMARRAFAACGPGARDSRRRQ